MASFEQRSAQDSGMVAHMSNINQNFKQLINLKTTSTAMHQRIQTNGQFYLLPDWLGWCYRSYSLFHLGTILTMSSKSHHFMHLKRWKSSFYENSMHVSVFLFPKCCLIFSTMTRMHVLFVSSDTWLHLLFITPELLVALCSNKFHEKILNFR